MLNPVTVLYKQKPSYKTPDVLEGTQTANHANSTSPSSATLSNADAGYTTLGGRFQFAAVAGAATDYALFAYQAPSTHRLIVDGIAIDTVNTGAAVATTATILDWSVGINSTAVSLATTDSDPTYGPRRIPIGIQTLKSGDAIGQQALFPISKWFANALVVEPNRYFHVILQMPVGTATSSQIIRGDIFVCGWFESIREGY